MMGFRFSNNTSAMSVLFIALLLLFGNCSETSSPDPDDHDIPLGPILTVSDSMLDFGKSNTAAEIIISNTGDQPLEWSASEYASWLSIAPASGNTEAQVETDTVSFQVDRTGLTANRYSTVLSINSNGGNKSIQVSIVVYFGARPGQWSGTLTGESYETGTISFLVGQDSKTITDGVIHAVRHHGSTHLEWNYTGISVPITGIPPSWFRYEKSNPYLSWTGSFDTEEEASGRLTIIDGYDSYISDWVAHTD